MLMVHDLVDTLLQRSGKAKLHIYSGTTREHLNRIPLLAQQMLKAAKFDFGELHLEQVADGTWRLPGLDDNEMGFWRDGLIPLPFDVCWYEFTLNGSRSGLLVWIDEQENWCIERYDWSTKIQYDGLYVSGSPKDWTPDNMEGEGFPIHFRGPTNYVNLVERDERLQRYYSQNLPIAVYFTLMLNSKTTEMRVERADPKANAQRISLRRCPKQDHRIVTIVPKRFVGGEKVGEGVGKGKRLHWRRSHLRHFENHTPSSKWCPEMIHPDKDGVLKRGWWVTVIPRHLVGQAELGEISHDYRVKHD